MSSSTIDALISIGLGENEARLYELLLKKTSATIVELQRASPFSRTMLYYILGNLTAAGLATAAKNGSKTAYSAEPPEKIFDVIKEKEQDLARQKAGAAQLVTDLGAMYRLAQNKPGIRFFEGMKGVQEALDDSLTATEPVYTFLDYDAVRTYAANLDESQHTARRAKNIKKRILVVNTPLARQVFPGQDTDTEVKFLSRAIKLSQTTVQIYNNKVVYFTLRAENMIAVMLVDPDLYAMQRSIFDYIWNAASAPIKTGAVAFRGE